MNERSEELKRVPDTMDSSLIVQVQEDLMKRVHEAVGLIRPRYQKDTDTFIEETKEDDSITPASGEKLAALLDLKTTVSECIRMRGELIRAVDLASSSGGRDPKALEIARKGRLMTQQLEDTIGRVRSLYPTQ